MSRFIPTPLDWTIHPICVQLREEDPAYPDRWLHLVRRAHVEGQGGKLTWYDGRPMTAEDLAHDHDRNCRGWESFIEFSLSLDLLEISGELLSVSSETWKQWYRAPSQYPEVEKHRKDADRKKSELEEVRLELAMLARERDDLKRKLKTKIDPNQLELEIRLEERADRLPDQEDSERDADSQPEKISSEKRSDRLPGERIDPDADSGLIEDYGGPPGSVRSCPESSGVVQSRPDNTCRTRSTCINRDTTNTRVDSPVSNVVYMGSEEAKADFLRKANALFVRISKRKWDGGATSGKAKLLKALEQPWAQEYPDPESWWWALASAVQETQERMKEGKQIKSPWGYAISLLEKYAAFGDATNWKKKRGEPANFVRLRELEAV